MCTLNVTIYTTEKKLYNRVQFPSLSSSDSCATNQQKRKTFDEKQYIVFTLNGVLVHQLMQALSGCQQCRHLFVNYLTQLENQSNFAVIRLRIILTPLSHCPDTIDYNWNAKVGFILRERSELDHALSWLSTLGGAFSALGDYFAICAETAAKISAHQFQLALRMGDPSIAARCRLYFALSLIQRKQFRLAKSMVWNEFRNAKTALVLDERLLKMCHGIWAKLKYEWGLYRTKIRSRS